LKLRLKIRKTWRDPHTKWIILRQELERSVELIHTFLRAKSTSSEDMKDALGPLRMRHGLKKARSLVIREKNPLQSPIAEWPIHAGGGKIVFLRSRTLGTA